MQLALPHPAVMLGTWCRLWQVGGFVCVGDAMHRLSAGTGASGCCCWKVVAYCCRLQAGVVALAACMLYTLRGRINGRTVLPSASGVAAALQGPKHH